MARILLGVCGGIAAYKSAGLTSRLVQRGDDVEVIMTDEAQRFVGPMTFAALTGKAVHTTLWDQARPIAHIALVRNADVLVIAPATANMIAKIAGGVADDLLTNAALASRIPLVVAPAMNSAMYDHAATRGNLALLRGRGATIVEPELGYLAEGERGIGRLAAEESLLGAIDRVLQRRHDLTGERVLITAGPTREPIDPVRFLSNASTGAMGIELAREALARGAAVDLILGPSHLDVPSGASVVRVTTAQEMHDAVMARLSEATIVIAAAAVADWRARTTYDQKVKKVDAVATIDLERTPDILAEIGAKKRAGMFLVGFAAETQSHEANAREKLVRKHLDAIAVNDVGTPGSGFGTGENDITLLFGERGRAELGRAPKTELAARIWTELLHLMRERSG